MSKNSFRIILKEGFATIVSKLFETKDKQSKSIQQKKYEFVLDGKKGEKQLKRKEENARYAHLNHVDQYILRFSEAQTFQYSSHLLGIRSKNRKIFQNPKTLSGEFPLRIYTIIQPSGFFKRKTGYFFIFI